MENEMGKKLIGTEGVDYVVCRICGGRFKLLDSHLPRTHNMTKEQYLKLYPDSLLICEVSVQHRKDAQDKIDATNLERYGVKRPTQSEKIRDKVKATNIERFGAEHPMQTEKSKNKYKETSMRNYGVDNPLKSKEVQDKMKQTNLEKYGFVYIAQIKIFRDKINETNMERYGGLSPFNSEVIQNKRTETLLERYGVEHPIQCKVIYDKYKQTHLERYGFEYPMQSNIIYDKMKITNLENYGFEYPCQPEIARIKNSCTQRGISVDDFDGFSHDKGDWRIWANAIYINKWFEGCHRHHITETIVACIPAELHGHISHNLKTGNGMAEMNMLALQYINGCYDD